MVSTVLDDSDILELVLRPKHDDDETLYQGIQATPVKECNASTQNTPKTDASFDGMSSSSTNVRENATPVVSKSDDKDTKEIPCLSTVVAVKEEAPENVSAMNAKESKRELKDMTASASKERVVQDKDEEQPLTAIDCSPVSPGKQQEVAAASRKEESSKKCVKTEGLPANPEKENDMHQGEFKACIGMSFHKPIVHFSVSACIEISTIVRETH